MYYHHSCCCVHLSKNISEGGQRPTLPAPMYDAMHRLFTVPYFFREIVEIERVLPLMAAILIFKCTEGEGVGDYSSIILASSQTVPRPLSRFDTLPQFRLRTFEIKIAAINGKTRSISTISRKGREL